MNKEMYVSTGLIPVDIMLSGKGIQLGKVYEIFGNESIGKSTIPLYFAIKFTNQLPNSKILYIDTEYAFDMKRYLYMQGKKEKLVLVLDEIVNQRKEKDKDNPVFFEDIFAFLKEAFQKAKQQNEVLFIIWDSLPATISQKEGQIGGLSREATKLFREIRPLLYKTNSVLFIVNQVYDRVGSVGTTTKGGRASKYFSDVRMKVVKEKEYVREVGDDVKITEEIDVRLETVKNKLMYAGISITLRLHGERGLNELGSILGIAKKEGIFSCKGSWSRLKWKDIDLNFNSAKSFEKQLSKYPEALDVINYKFVLKYSTISPLVKYKLLDVLNEYEEKLGLEKTELTEADKEKLGAILNLEKEKV